MPKIDHLFDDLLSKKGSDLHLAVGHPPLGRIHGDLVPLRDAIVDTAEIESTLFEIVNDAQRAKIKGELDLDFAYAYADKARFRANYFHKITGLAAVFRAIPAQILTLEQLRCPDAVRRLAQLRAGLVLVTGTTGSGKSTTLAAMIRYINQTRACHVLTIEDPVEFVHVSEKAQITHREIGRDAPTFAAAIRSAGREDPNVVLIGELRGPETMKLAVQLASFGVLVFATVHTNSAPATIDRILNAFPADEQPQVRGLLAECLAGVVAQQLVKSADGKGRCGVYEILVSTPGISAMIREGKTFQIPSVIQGSQALGMQTMDMALERLVKEARVRPEVALAYATDKESLEKRLG
jgi:twitching motility protein PilT